MGWEMSFLKAFVGLFLAVQLASCSSTANTSSALIDNQQKRQQQNLETGGLYAMTDLCYSNGFIDAEFTAKTRNSIDFVAKLQGEQLDKNLVSFYRQQIKQLYQAFPLEELKAICYNLKPSMVELTLSTEEAKRAIEIKQNRPVVINNSQPSYTPPTYSLPKTTTCNNLGFGMTSCTTF